MIRPHPINQLRDGNEVALASAASNFKLKVSKMDVIKINCATIRDGEACAYLTDDHGVAPQDRPRMWASGHGGHIKRAAHGYEATREAAMAAFAKSWRRQ